MNPPDSLCKYVGCFNRSETCFSSRRRRSERCARLAFPSHPNPVRSVLSSSLCCFGGVKILCLQTCGREWGNACEHQEASSYEKAKVFCAHWLVDGTRQTTRYFQGYFASLIICAKLVNPLCDGWTTCGCKFLQQLKPNGRRIYEKALCSSFYKSPCQSVFSVSMVGGDWSKQQRSGDDEHVVINFSLSLVPRRFSTAGKYARKEFRNGNLLRNIL